jgi:glycosyl transferase family 25
MQVYAISIRSSRLKAFVERARPLEFTIVDGVHGDKLSYKHMEADHVYKALPYFRLSRGTLGCYLSHRSVWEHIAKGQQEFALVLEDDADFRANMIPLVESLVKQVQEFDARWNFIVMGQTTKLAIRGREAPEGFYVPSRCMGLHAYVLSKRGAEMLLSHSLPVQEAVDVFVTSFQCPGKYATVRNVCNTLNFGSDVEHIQ